MLKLFYSLLEQIQFAEELDESFSFMFDSDPSLTVLTIDEFLALFFITKSSLFNNIIRFMKQVNTVCDQIFCLIAVILHQIFIHTLQWMNE